MTLSKIILVMAPLIQLPPDSPINPEVLLRSIAKVESSFGDRSCAGKAEEHMIDDVQRAHPKQYWKYGDKLAMSFGAFQVLGTVAYELGHSGDPNELCDDVVGTHWAIQYLNRRVFGRESHKHLFVPSVPLEDQIRSVGDTYNSGSGTDRYVPEKYIEDLWNAYQEEL